jgi:hypothetical protein
MYEARRNVVRYEIFTPCCRGRKKRVDVYYCVDGEPVARKSRDNVMRAKHFMFRRCPEIDSCDYSAQYRNMTHHWSACWPRNNDVTCC